MTKQPMAKHLFYQHWQAEVIRQRELHWGPLADDQAMRAAKLQERPDDKLFTRAARLCDTHGFVPAMHHYQRWLGWLLWAMAALAIVSGIGLATSITPQGRATISLLDALLSLFLLNTLLILLWAVSHALGERTNGFGALLDPLSKVLLRQGQLLTVAQAHTSLSVHQRLWRPALASVSHGFWFILLSSAWLTLTLRFISYDYQFEWRSTLLNESNIESVIGTLSILPQWLGVAPPETPQSTAIWLLACLLLYAILPRLLLLLGAEITRRVRLARLQVDWQLTGFETLYQQFAPTKHDPQGGHDESWHEDSAPAHIQVLPTSHLSNARPKVSPRANAASTFAWSTLEWPASPAAVQQLVEQAHLEATGKPANAHQALGDISTREQRQQTVIQQQRQARHLLLIVNPSLSPDRGSLRFIAELEQAGPLAIYIPQGPRSALWQNQLQKHLQTTVFDQRDELVLWLQTH